MLKKIDNFVPVNNGFPVIPYHWDNKAFYYYYYYYYLLVNNNNNNNKVYYHNNISLKQAKFVGDKE